MSCAHTHTQMRTQFKIFLIFKKKKQPMNLLQLWLPSQEQAVNTLACVTSMDGVGAYKTPPLSGELLAAGGC